MIHLHLPALLNVGMQFSSSSVIGDPKSRSISSSPMGVPVIPGIAHRPQKTKANTIVTNWIDILVNLPNKSSNKRNSIIDTYKLISINIKKENIPTDYRKCQIEKNCLCAVKAASWILSRLFWWVLFYIHWMSLQLPMVAFVSPKRGKHVHWLPRPILYAHLFGLM